MSNKKSSICRKYIISIIEILACVLLVGCVNQNPEQTMEVTKSTEGQPRVVATSVSVVEIFDRLEIDLIGVCDSELSTLPERYNNVTRVGLAMNPDIEVIASLKPDWIFSPSSLQSDLEPKYKNLNTEWGFLNLRSVDSMYASVKELGELFDREEQVMRMIEEYQEFYQEFKKKNENKKKPKVLVLMGLPGSYIIATENSYIGSLVDLAGGDNVYAGTKQEFLTVNTEDMKTKEPDIILRAAHALPENVVKMFDKEFQTNDIWKHFHAVQEGYVYDLSYELFGMSATFEYPNALEELQGYLYPNTEQ